MAILNEATGQEWKGDAAMEKGTGTTMELGLKGIGSYDFAGPAERMKAIDLAMRQYFGTDNWLTTRNKRFPGLQRKP